MANQHIKGITVEIGGNASELSQVLKGVDKDAKAVTDELKSVNAALKVDPGNVVALTQKTELLSQSIENTKKKIDILKKAEADAQQQLAKGEIGADQYRALQREVVFAEGKLKKLEKQLDDTKKAAQSQGDAVEKAGKDAENASKKNKELGKSLDALKKDYDKAKKSAKDAATKLGVGLGVAGAVGTAAVMEAMSYADALDAIRMRTGASEEAMASYELAMKSVFDSGLGEDLDDVASTMAEIAQQTNETDPEKLGTMAQNALILRDSFGYETAEQLRAVDQLTKQFGISSEEAYNLIVEGTQKGLNKNGDLMDVLNEYSVHYKNLGYDAEGFFNSLANGTASGVFSVDKLGDAMKEFGIKTKDEAASTTEAYELLGLNADEIRQKFALGGESAQEAAKQVNDALFSMDDAVQQNTVGVALYGTMWEDLGKESVQALTDTTGEITATGDAMEKVRDIKLDSTATKWSKLGRTVQSELLIPMGEKLLPYVEKFFNFCIENSEELIPIVKTVGAVIGTIFVVNKASKFITSIKNLTSAFKSLKTASASAGSSLGKVGVAATALALTLGPMISETEAASKAYREGVQKLKEMAQAYRQAADAAKDSAQRQEDAYNKVNFDYKKYEDLAVELQGLTDADGRVKDSAAERAQYIRDELSAAADIEIQIVDGVIQEYEGLATAIDDALTARKTYDMLTSMEGDYDDAKAALTGDEAVVGSQLAYEQAAYRYNQLYRIANDSSLTWDERNEAMKALDMTEQEWSEGGGEAAARFAMQEAQRAYEYNLDTVNRYEALSKAYDSQDADKMRTAAEAIANPQYVAGEYSYALLRERQVEAQKTYDNMLTWSKEEGTTITQAQLAEAAENLQFATQQAMLQWEAEGKPYYSEEGEADPEYIPYAHWSMQGAARQTQILLGEGVLAASGNPLKSGAWKHTGRSALEGFIDVTAENRLPYDLSTPAAEASKQSNELLGQILKKINRLDLKLVLDDDTLVGRTAGKTDRALGTAASDEKRGAMG